jgi:23S rRNA pseudouridine1911/1915/1917 synthase
MMSSRGEPKKPAHPPRDLPCGSASHAAGLKSEFELARSPHGQTPPAACRRELQFVITVAESDVGQRLDNLVSSYRSDCSRSFAATLIQDGHITIQNNRKKPGYRVKPGQKIHVRIPVYEPPSVQPQAMPLNILFEDRHLIVIDKPAGLVVHPAPGNETGTLVNGLLYHCPELGGINAELRPGIVHRLDKDTSGTMVVAKSRSVLENLSQQFKSREVQKTYLALVHGVLGPESGNISLPIGRHPVDRKKMSTISARGRDAETLWRVKIRYAGATLLELALKTGRTHQIRVHCTSMRHPIIGDDVYTYGKWGKKIRNATPLETLLRSAGRQMLHAWHLSFTHPVEQRAVSFTAPIPKDMQRLMDGLALLGDVLD